MKIHFIVFNLVFTCIAFLSNPILAQKKQVGIPKSIKIRTGESDSTIEEKLKLAGYPEAGIVDSNSSTIQWRVGPKYFYSKINIQGITDLQYKAWKTPFSFVDWEQKTQYFVQQAEKEGYAFAELQVLSWKYSAPDSLTRGVEIDAKLNNGRLIVFDSIIVPAHIREKPRLIYQYLRIRPGMVYQPDYVQQIPTLLNNSTWFKQAKKPTLIFSDSSVKVMLDMKNARANQFDVLVGLLPPKVGQTTFQFTVLADIHLISAFRRGEEIGLKYEKLPGSSQKLNLMYRHPYPFRLPVSTQVKFELWKQDTLFLNRSLEAGAVINPGGLLRLTFSWQNKFSTLLSSAAYRTVKWPPPVINSHANSGLIGFIFDSRDDRLNPRKGVWLQTDAGLGARVIRKTLGLDSLDYSKLTPRQVKTEAFVKIQKFTTFAKRHIFMLGAEAYRLGLKQYFDSDAKYFGGAYSLRGFNENQFQATSVVMSTIEYRFWLEQRSFLSIFADFAWFEQKRIMDTLTQQALGTGLSLAFDTPAGMIQVAYAMGMTRDSRFQPGRGRIHVGLINQF